MSIYRSQVARLMQDDADLQKKIGVQLTKQAKLEGEIGSIGGSITKSTSASTAQMKIRQVEGKRKELAKVQETLADLQRKRSSKIADLNRSRQNLERAEEQETKKRRTDEIRHAKTVTSEIDKQRRLQVQMSRSPLVFDMARLPTKIKVLFLAANPLDTISPQHMPLRLDEEVRAIQQKIRASEHRDSVELISRWAVRTDLSNTPLEEQHMTTTISTAIRRCAQAALRAVHRRLLAWTKPATGPCVGSTVGDLTRTKAALLAENAFLRHQLVVLDRQVKRPVLTPADRLRLVLLARLVRGWRAAPLVVQPDTLLRWHRQGLRLVWRARSRGASKRPQLPAETVAAIQRLAAENRLWGAASRRGERLKRGVRVSKRPLQKPPREAPPPRRAGQTGAPFLRDHGGDIWVGDSLPVTDLCCRPVYACFVIARGSRRVEHVGVTRHPTDARVAQQRRAATPCGAAPRFLIRDNDAQYGPRCDRLAAASGIRDRRALPGARAAGVPGPGPHPRRGAAATRAPRVCGLLQPRPAPARDRPGGPGAISGGATTRYRHWARGRHADPRPPPSRLSPRRLTASHAENGAAA